MADHKPTIPTPTAFNLPLSNHIPDKWIPLECVVAVECLDEDGVKRLYICATAGITTWTAAGALQAAADSYRDDLRADLQPTDEE